MFMETEMPNDSYDEYNGEEKKNKNTFKIALVLLVLFIGVLLVIYAFFSLDSKSDSNNTLSGETPDENNAPTTKDKVKSFLVTYEYTNSKFIFSIKNICDKSIGSLSVIVDSVQFEYTVSSGKLPLQKNESMFFIVEKQFCDKEHKVTVIADDEEQKITTYPLVCAFMDN